MSADIKQKLNDPIAPAAAPKLKEYWQAVQLATGSTFDPNGEGANREFARMSIEIANNNGKFTTPDGKQTSFQEVMASAKSRLSGLAPEQQQQILGNVSVNIPDDMDAKMDRVVGVIEDVKKEKEGMGSMLSYMFKGFMDMARDGKLWEAITSFISGLFNGGLSDPSKFGELGQYATKRAADDVANTVDERLAIVSKEPGMGEFLTASNREMIKDGVRQGTIDTVMGNGKPAVTDEQKIDQIAASLENVHVRDNRQMIEGMINETVDTTMKREFKTQFDQGMEEQIKAAGFFKGKVMRMYMPDDDQLDYMQGVIGAQLKETLTDTNLAYSNPEELKTRIQTDVENALTNDPKMRDWTVLATNERREMIAGKVAESAVGQYDLIDTAHTALHDLRMGSAIVNAKDKAYQPAAPQLGHDPDQPLLAANAALPALAGNSSALRP